MPDATDRYYHALGKMICRAAEAEVLMESLASDLYGSDQKAWSGVPTNQIADAVTKAAPRWPNQAAQIGALVDVMNESAQVRNWLVHAWVLSAGNGEWVELQKPMRGHPNWGRRRIWVEEVYVLAARFRWVFDAITRVVNERTWEEDNSPASFAEPLREAPPMPAFADPNRGESLT